MSSESEILLDKSSFKNWYRAKPWIADYKMNCKYYYSSGAMGFETCGEALLILVPWIFVFVYGCSYRTNYFIMIVAILGKRQIIMYYSVETRYWCLHWAFSLDLWITSCAFCIAALGFLRRPLAIVAAFLTTLSIAFLNDRYFTYWLLHPWVKICCII